MILTWRCENRTANITRKYQFLYVELEHWNIYPSNFHNKPLCIQRTLDEKCFMFFVWKIEPVLSKNITFFRQKLCQKTNVSCPFSWKKQKTFRCKSPFRDCMIYTHTSADTTKWHTEGSGFSVKRQFRLDLFSSTFFV